MISRVFKPLDTVSPNMISVPIHYKLLADLSFFLQAHKPLVHQIDISFANMVMMPESSSEALRNMHQLVYYCLVLLFPA